MGGFRTALYNYLFAKSKGGKYILRIEDTDRSRVVDGAVEQLQEDLKWLGIEFDEGPGNNEHYGPYIQSKRLENYKYKYIEKSFFFYLNIFTLALFIGKEQNNY